MTGYIGGYRYPIIAVRLHRQLLWPDTKDKPSHGYRGQIKQLHTRYGYSGPITRIISAAITASATRSSTHAVTATVTADRLHRWLQRRSISLYNQNAYEYNTTPRLTRCATRARKITPSPSNIALNRISNIQNTDNKSSQ